MNNFPRAYACYNKNSEIRMQSTSGGAFTCIATYFINQYNADIYGAAFNQNLEVMHMCISSVEDLGKLRGSKYPQSKIGDSYIEIKEKLLRGKTVLFVGTPCQIEALHQFLDHNFESLWTMDFVCHGVASNKIWRDYISNNEHHGRLKNIVFKYKYRGWKKWYVKKEYVAKTTYIRGSMDIFMRSFLRNTNVRPSCYKCSFKGLKRTSDFTISDCWGIGEKNTELNDDKGLSALLLQNQRAVSVFEKIKQSLEFQEYDSNILMEGNWTAFQSVKPSADRQRFFDMYEKYGYEKAMNKFFKPTIISWVNYYLKRIRGVEK